MLLRNTYNEFIKIVSKPRSYLGFGALTILISIIIFAMKMDGETIVSFITASFEQTLSFNGKIVNGNLIAFIILQMLVEPSFIAASELMPIGSGLVMLHPSHIFPEITLRGDRQEWLQALDMLLLKQSGVGHTGYSGMKRKISSDLLSIFVKVQPVEVETAIPQAVKVFGMSSDVNLKQQLFQKVTDLRAISDSQTEFRYRSYIASFALYGLLRDLCDQQG